MMIKHYIIQSLKKLLDIGDFIGIDGYVFTTQTGEVSIHVTRLVVLSKSLKPLPIVKETTDESGNVIKHDSFEDAELRYRQRYVDLVVNPEVKDTFVKRTMLVNSMREYLNEKGLSRGRNSNFTTSLWRCCCQAIQNSSQHFGYDIVYENSQ